MLRPRIIPCLLLSENGLVKTVNFDSPKYVGDPINAVRIFNEKCADEIMVLDITASIQNKPPNFSLIEKLAKECRVPFTYGGGIKQLQEIETIIGYGVEKVALSSAAISNPELISEASKLVGSQSIAVVVDVRRNDSLGEYEIFTMNGHKKHALNFANQMRIIQDMGAGEIIINSIDRDGTLQGYDFKILSLIANSTTLPITLIGGMNGIANLKEMVEEYGAMGAGVGSYFIFKGPYRAVLISYPDRDAIKGLHAACKIC
jgi:cyclase